MFDFNDAREARDTFENMNKKKHVQFSKYSKWSNLEETLEIYDPITYLISRNDNLMPLSKEESRIIGLIERLSPYRITPMIYEERLEYIDNNPTKLTSLNGLGGSKLHGVCDMVFSSFKEKQIKARKELCCNFILDSELVSELYTLSFNPDDDHDFLRLLDLIWCHLIRFHPGDMLSNQFKKYRRPTKSLSPKLFEYARRLYMNEIRTINEEVFFSDLSEIKRIVPSYQTYLRGKATLIFAQIVAAEHFVMDKELLITLGSIKWPVNRIFEIALLLREYKNKERSRKDMLIGLNETRDNFMRFDGPLRSEDLLEEYYFSKHGISPKNLKIRKTDEIDE